jgi:hypothetical protein
MTEPLRQIRSSVRAYELLVRAYPASFRKEYADEMTLVFCELVTDAWRRRGAVGLLLAWFRVLGDLARTAPKEHVHEMRRRLEMKRAALALLSVIVAGFAYSVFFFVGAVLIMFPLIAGMNRFLMSAGWIVVMYLAAFLIGLVQTRIKQIAKPMITVPVGTMATWSVWGLCVLADNLSMNRVPLWGECVGWLGLAASVSFTAYLGCLVAAKAQDRVARFAVPWYQLIGPLAVLICTSFTACTLRLVLLCHDLEPEIRHSLSWSLFALGAAATIASLVILFVRTYRRVAIP